jgi:hypothetical protein
LDYWALVPPLRPNITIPWPEFDLGLYDEPTPEPEPTAANDTATESQEPEETEEERGTDDTPEEDASSDIEEINLDEQSDAADDPNDFRDSLNLLDDE